MYWLSFVFTQRAEDVYAQRHTKQAVSYPSRYWHTLVYSCLIPGAPNAVLLRSINLWTLPPKGSGGKRGVGCRMRCVPSTYNQSAAIGIRAARQHS